jgi:histidyl-tRNA synthetase
VKSALKHADRLGTRYVAIVDGDGMVGFKDMESSEQHEMRVHDVIPTILRGHRL